jgi:hypothetical protein
MRSALISIAALAMVATTATPARADGWYFSESFGGASMGDELGQYFDADAAFRLAVGRRIGRLVIEGYVQGTFLTGKRWLEYDYYSLTTFGFDAKHYYQLGKLTRAYLRGGFGRAEMSDDGWRDEYGIGMYGGRILSYGGGVQVSGKVRALGFLFWPLFFAKTGPKVSASAFVDLNRQIMRLHHPRGPSLDGRLTTLMVGFKIGGDF